MLIAYDVTECSIIPIFGMWNGKSERTLLIRRFKASSDTSSEAAAINDLRKTWNQECALINYEKAAITFIDDSTATI